MLIGFVGLPNSGKTTIASKLFAHLKEKGSTAELIVEQARFYIAKKRLNSKNLGTILDSKEKVISLTDEDQINITALQFKYENLMSLSCSKDTYIVSDSSTINSFLYMSKEKWADDSYRKVLGQMAKSYDLLIFCHAFDLEDFIPDQNRVHSKDQVIALNDRSKELLHLLKEYGINVKEILGTLPLESRCKETYLVVAEEYFKYVQGLVD